MLSSVGDLWGGLHNFALQLSFFAAAHLCYATAFFSNHDRSRRLLSAVSVAVALLLTGAVLLTAIRIGLGATMTTGVTLYAALITAMTTAAVTTVGNRYRWLAVAGALLFVVSDSALAYNKFITAIPYRTLIVMSTYYAAQLSIALYALCNSSANRPGQAKDTAHR